MHGISERIRSSAESGVKQFGYVTPDAQTAFSVKRSKEMPSIAASMAKALPLSRIPSSSDCLKGGLPEWKIKRVQAFILENLSSSISGEDMATVCGLSVSHFQRAFQSSFNCSPHRYVTTLRLELARQMLVKTDLPIKFIALECGMADQSHLNKVLKREWSVTPCALRREGGLKVSRSDRCR